MALRKDTTCPASQAVSGFDLTQFGLEESGILRYAKVA